MVTVVVVDLEKRKEKHFDMSVAESKNQFGRIFFVQKRQSNQRKSQNR